MPPHKWSLSLLFVNFGQLGPNSMLWCSDDDANNFIGFLFRRGARSIWKSSWSDEQNIYFELIPLMCKVGQNCNVGLEPQQLCHTPSQMNIYWTNLEVIFIIHSSHTSLVSDWFDHHLGGSSSLTRGKTQQGFFCSDLGFHCRFD